MFYTPRFIPKTGFWLGGSAVDLKFTTQQYHGPSLVLGSGTNIFFGATQDATLGFAVANTTITADPGDTPDIAIRSAKLMEDATASVIHDAFKIGTVVALNTSYTASGYLKDGPTNGRRYVNVALTDSPGNQHYATFDLQTGTITENGGALTGSHTLVAVGNGWYRFTITTDITSGAGTIAGLYILLSNTATPGSWLPSYNGDGVSNILIAGPKIEQGSVATAFSPTPYDFLSCSRASVGYAETVAGMLIQFATGALRITDKGLLIEDARTNVALYSQTMHAGQVAGSWIENAIASVDASGTAPDGTNTASKLTEDSTSDFHRSYQNYTSSVGFWAHSGYVKDGTSNGRRYLVIKCTDNATSAGYEIIIDLSNGTVTQNTNIAGSGNSYSVETLANGWYRWTIILNSASAGVNATIQYFLTNSGTGSYPYSYLGDGVSNILIWGTQAELGSFASSYIPTTTAAATRAADVVAAASMLDALFTYNQQSVVADITALAVPNDYWGIIADISGYLLLTPLSGSNTALAMYGGGSATLGNSLTFTGGVKCGASQGSVTGRSLVGGGGTVFTDTAATISITDARIGGGGVGAMFYGYYRRLTAWSSKLADATLQQYTDPSYSGALAGFAVDLNFAAGAYAANQNELLGMLSCSRASVGYAQTVAGTLTLFQNNQLRITDKGLLIEDARTNTLTYSQAFNGHWTSASATAVDNSTTAPDGTTTAAKLVEASGFANQTIYANPTAATGVFSCYFKQGTRRYCSLQMQSGTSSYTVLFDLQSGTIVDTQTDGTTPTGTSSSIEAIANGWYRCSIRADYTSGSMYTFIGMSDANPPSGGWAGNLGRPTYTGDGTSYIYIWGAQYEAAAFASSYIPTTTAAATRAQDFLTCISALGAVFRSPAVSVVADATFPDLLARPTGYQQKLIGDNTKYFLSTDPTDVGTKVTNYDGSSFLTTAAFGSSWMTGVKTGVSWNASARSVVGDGGTVATDAGGFLSVADTHIGGALDVIANNQWYGYVRRLTAWSSRLADATLQSLTNP